MVLITLLMLYSASARAQQKTSDAERELFSAVNRERKAHGLKPLKLERVMRLSIGRAQASGRISFPASPISSPGREPRELTSPGFPKTWTRDRVRRPSTRAS